MLINERVRAQHVKVTEIAEKPSVFSEKPAKHLLKNLAPRITGRVHIRVCVCVCVIR